MVFEGSSVAISHTGKVRSNNQDSGYAGTHLFVVADGMGGHAGGDVASSLAIARLQELDVVYTSPMDAEQALQDGITDAARELSNQVPHELSRAQLAVQQHAQGHGGIHMAAGDAADPVDQHGQHQAKGQSSQQIGGVSLRRLAACGHRRAAAEQDEEKRPYEFRYIFFHQ